MANATTVVKADTIGGPAISTRNRVRTASKIESPFAISRAGHTGSCHVDSIQVAFTFECSLPSEVAAVSPFIEEFMQLIARCSGVPGSEIDVEIALREAVVNAVVHGNHEDPRKQVYVRCRCEPGGISILVRDEGEGFDADRVPDPTAPENIESTRGRGIYLMRAYMDEVRFEEGGRAVLMRKRAPSAETRIQGNRLSVGDTNHEKRKTWNTGLDSAPRMGKRCLDGFGVDLDGTLAKSVKAQTGEEIGIPIHSMVQLVKAWLAHGEDVRIFTARVNPNRGRVNAMRARRAIQFWCKRHLGQVLPITHEKDWDMTLLLDDRARQVERDTGRVVGGPSRKDVKAYRYAIKSQPLTNRG